MISFVGQQIFHELTCFFRRWYFERSNQLWSLVFYFLGALDKNFAVAINARLWLQPLYGDYSFVGRIIGPILRTLRIVFGSLIYLVILALAFFVWLGWVLLLPFLLWLIFYCSCLLTLTFLPFIRFYFYFLFCWFFFCFFYFFFLSCVSTVNLFQYFQSKIFIHKS